MILSFLIMIFAIVSGLCEPMSFQYEKPPRKIYNWTVIPGLGVVPELDGTEDDYPHSITFSKFLLSAVSFRTQILSGNIEIVYYNSPSDAMLDIYKSDSPPLTIYRAIAKESGKWYGMYGGWNSFFNRYDRIDAMAQIVYKENYEIIISFDETRDRVIPKESVLGYLKNLENYTKGVIDSARVIAGETGKGGPGIEEALIAAILTALLFLIWSILNQQGKLLSGRIPNDLPESLSDFMNKTSTKMAKQKGVMIASSDMSAFQAAAQELAKAFPKDGPSPNPVLATQIIRKQLRDFCKKIAKDLEMEGYYPINPVSVESSWWSIWDLAVQAERRAYDVLRPLAGPGDYTGENVHTEPKAIPCRDYVNLTEHRLKVMVGRMIEDWPESPEERDAKIGEWKLEIIAFRQEPPLPPPGLVGDAQEFLFTLKEKDHILFKITFPDGQQSSIDFWDNARRGGPVMIRWEHQVEKFRELFGQHFKIKPQKWKDFGIGTGKYGKYDVWD